MTERGSKSFEQLKEAYPDLRVDRDSIGVMHIDQILQTGDTRAMSLYLARESEDQEKVGVGISIRTVPQGKNPSEGSPYSYLTLVPSGEGVRLVTKNIPQELSVNEVFRKVRQGLELFDAFLQADPKTIRDYTVEDKLGEPGELERKVFEGSNIDITRAEERGLTVSGDPTVHDAWKYMQSLLRKPIEK